jgi:asparagine synthase (glutamine-hydrolysing)
MCGIVGLINYAADSPVNARLIQAMTDKVSHRGPDDSGLYVERNVGLGHRRLSILDLSKHGHQPMANSDGTIWIAYNGECYNYRDFYPELRARGYEFHSTSDTEVLLCLYQEYGLSFLDRVAGMFALAIWDSRARRLVLARDRLGIKPLFYYHDRDHLVFGSELKALLLDPAVPRQIDYNAVEAFLRVGSVPDPYSIYRDIKRLRPAHMLILESGSVRLHRYWELPAPNGSPRRSLESVAGDFRERFEDIVKAHLISDVPVGAFLSGGVDSSSIVAMASRHVDQPMQTFSVTFPDHPEFDESETARTVATHCGARHSEINFKPHMIDIMPTLVQQFDEPFGTSSAAGLYYLAQQASQKVKVVLCGDGADEVFAGYTWRHGPPPWPPREPGTIARRLAKHLIAAVQRKPPPTPPIWATPTPEGYLNLINVMPHETVLELLNPDLAQGITEDYWLQVTRDHFETHSDADWLHRKLYTDIQTTLVSEMLTKVDRMTMTFGLEARVPFLDHRLVEWAFQIAGVHKLHKGQGKRLVKKAMEPLLPHSILYRPKRGFTAPLRDWWKTELREYTFDMLSEERIRRHGLFQPEQVAKQIKMHFDGVWDLSNRIYYMMMIQTWFDHQAKNTTYRDDASCSVIAT